MVTKSSKSFVVAWTFYLLIVFEIIYMISPFGIYYYSIYGPGLNLFHKNGSVAWLSSFFLPHLVETSSFFLNCLKDVGWLMIAAGLSCFCICAVHIYFNQFTKRGAVTKGIYRIMRHPQYAALMVAGFGMLLVWPRFLVLLMYITMLFVYYFLARQEERICAEKYGVAYLAYQRTTSMFAPLKIPAAFKILLPPKSGWKRGASILGLYTAVMAIAIMTAFQVRNYALTTISAAYFNRSAVISISRMAPETIEKIWRIALKRPEVNMVIHQDVNYLNYVLPAEWYLSDLPMSIPDGVHGHHRPDAFSADRFKLIITRAHDADNKPMIKEDIIKRTCSRSALLEVYIDTAKGKVVDIRRPPGNVRWGNIPTPLF